MGNNYIIPSLDRALEIIGFLAKQPKGCGITVIADKLGYPKNSVFRILKTLAAKGYIIETDRLYQLSAKFLAIGYSAVILPLPGAFTPPPPVFTNPQMM